MPAQAEHSPMDLRFTRQATQRMIFDDDQALRLSSLEPAKDTGLELMHPVRRTTGQAELSVPQGRLVVRGEDATDASVWFSGFNPFATYQVEIAGSSDGTSAGLEFIHPGGEVLRVDAVCGQESIRGVRWSLQRKDEVLMKGEAEDFRQRPLAEHPVTLIVQMAAVGFNVYLKQRGHVELVGRADVVSHLDLRRKDVFQNTSTWLRIAGDKGTYAVIPGATAALTPGMGQADIRAITDEEGTPLLDGGRLWFTATTRGGGLPHPMQGVLSLDPGLSDLKFEGVIAFDRGDGLLRNELASHLFLDRASGEWRGWTTAFSAYGDPAKKEKKEILAVRSKKDPRRGFSIMTSAPMGLVGDYEDPHGIHDKETGKWRMLLCQNVNGYKAAVFESERWDGGFQRIAGPVTTDSTGTTIQKVDGVRYAFFGSSDRSFHVCSFPDLKPLGTLNLDLPPWEENGNARVWPNLVPLPEGSPAPYLLLTFDRTNFPGMKGPNWTYGAMHLYHGQIK
ncbi:hypothetical protein OKA04_05710 [Luteolibacter flavescens]|uniref:DUF4185 domain-containing protein n=1 Tax=Luteolibacter flavescens TaxID=1859460 RepID=A0ABT3FKW9_9BACT|nr:hypothetical protein [Luteolibacter flavescens]MCW1884218.1 hypothetical protein [Luteolibacter flavescens]